MTNTLKFLKHTQTTQISTTHHVVRGEVRDTQPGVPTNDAKTKASSLH